MTTWTDVFLGHQAHEMHARENAGRESAWRQLQPEGKTIFLERSPWYGVEGRRKRGCLWRTEEERDGAKREGGELAGRS
jgi:hypothetical protein